MSGSILPTNRPLGRALIIGSPACRGEPLNILQRLGFSCVEIDDPYTAAFELFHQPLPYGCLVLSLASLYREELALIGLAKRMPELDIWLVHTDGRQAALAEALRLGADGLLAEDGPHRTTPPVSAATPSPESEPEPDPEPEPEPEPNQSLSGAGEVLVESASGGRADEPVLTADELRALLQEQPSFPDGGE